jgi:nicotinamide phosphoribosyltransferase
MYQESGKQCEYDLIHKNLEQFKSYPMIAMVADTYDVFKFVDIVTSGDLKEKIESNEYPTFVIRPDSGNPLEVLSDILVIMERNKVSYKTNTKGYKVFDKYRFLWGDGINIDVIDNILSMLEKKQYSTTNVPFGMGGALLQQVDRDTQRFAMKCSCVRINGEYRDVYKDPITDQGKTSKKGRLGLFMNSQNLYQTRKIESVQDEQENLLTTVFESGQILKDYTMEEIRYKLHG